ncbi:hypothetical protein HN858_03150 [Candidatus Falkowbacteria bacterium]|nr:hypothetical protein [Candidatus Falkowbacteria bacterium]MBT7348648.1 hypothetical protein [Candidatus Falkowbacteria bacterium]
MQALPNIYLCDSIITAINDSVAVVKLIHRILDAAVEFAKYVKSKKKATDHHQVQDA